MGRAPSSAEAGRQEAAFRRAAAGGQRPQASPDLIAAFFAGYRADPRARAVVRTLTAAARALRILQ
eukprot:15443016-Alexandrium_andersonii.AAC.1